MFFSVAYDDPYLVAVLGESAEVRTVEPSLRVQSLALGRGARLVVRCRQGQLYAASQSEVWSLQAIPLAQQIRRLLEDKQFELALKLTVSTNYTTSLNFLFNAHFTIQ